MPTRAERTTESTADLPSQPRRGTGGRPSQAEALRRDERLVAVAADIFMARGFDATAMDAVAEAAGVGKATLYARYRDKGALFAAVLTRAVDRWLAPLGDAAATATGGDLRDALLAVARTMMAQSLAPEAVTLKRMMIAQASRFPDLARLVHTQGWLRTNAAIAALLARYADADDPATADPQFASDFFLSLVVGRQSQLAMLGIETDPRELDARLVAAVDFFLAGLRASRRDQPQPR